MAVNMVNDSLLKEITPRLVADVDFIYTILEAAGVIFIIYVIYLIISGFLSYKNNKRIRHTEGIVEKIEEKVNFLVLKEKERELLEEKLKHHKEHKFSKGHKRR